MGEFFRTFAAFIAILPFFYGACAFVHITIERPKTRYVVVGLFFTVAALIILYGLLSLTAPNIVNQRTGYLLLVLGAVTLLPMIKSVRRLFGRLTPLDPNSIVDISGLILLLWIVVIAGASLLTVDLAAVAEQVNVTVADAVVNVIAYPVIALCLVGIFVTRGWRESVKRLGLEPLTPRQIGIAIALVVPLLAVSVGLDYVGRALQPELYAQLEGVVRAMSSNVTNPVVAFVLAFSAGIGEEILMRGAIQPRYGIALTALVFAILHTQYGLTFAVAGILVVGVVLGYERKWINTTACIVTHGAYNTVAFLLPYLAGGS